MRKLLALRSLVVLTLIATIFSAPQIQASANDVTSDGGFNLVDLQAARDLGIDGKGWVIASIDQGVQLDNPYISDALLNDGYCYSANGKCSNGLNEMSGPGAGQAAKNADGSWNRDMTHGTGTAGVAVGQPNKDALGGVAPGAKFYAANNFGTIGGGGWTGVLKSLQHIYSIHDKYKFAAIYISQGGFSATRENYNLCTSEFTEEAAIIAKLKAVGIPVVMAAGNNASVAGINALACVADTIAVGGVNSDGSVATMSNIGPTIDLLAPICSTSSGYPGEYSNFCGTSGSAPFVAGAIALVRQANPNLSTDQVIQLLKRTGTPTSDVITKQIPIINIGRALRAAVCPGKEIKIANLSVKNADAAKAVVSLAITGSPSKIALYIDGKFSKNIGTNTQEFTITNDGLLNHNSVEIQLLGSDGSVASSKKVEIFFPKATPSNSCTPTGKVTPTIIGPRVWDFHYLPVSRQVVIKVEKPPVGCLFAELKTSSLPYGSFIVRNLNGNSQFTFKLPSDYVLGSKIIIKVAMVGDGGNYSPVATYVINPTLQEFTASKEVEQQTLAADMFSNEDKTLDSVVQNSVLIQPQEVATQNTAIDADTKSLLLEIEQCQLSIPRIDSISVTKIDSNHSDLAWKVSGNTFLVRITPKNEDAIYIKPEVGHFNVMAPPGASNQDVLVEALDSRLVSISRQWAPVSFGPNLPECTPTGKTSSIQVTPLLAFTMYHKDSKNLILAVRTTGLTGCFYIETSQPADAGKVHQLRFQSISNFFITELVINNPQFIDQNSAIQIRIVFIDKDGGMSPVMTAAYFWAGTLIYVDPGAPPENFGAGNRDTNMILPELNAVLQDSVLDALPVVDSSANQELAIALIKDKAMKDLLVNTDAQTALAKLNEVQKQLADSAASVKSAEAEIAKLQADAVLAAKLVADRTALADQQAAEIKALQAKIDSLKKQLPSTIICVKGTSTKSVTAVAPKCPTGYKVKN